MSSDNLGSRAGLVAGAALLIDYTLTVAVSVSAAVAAITSVIPGLPASECSRGRDRRAPDARQPAWRRESGTIFMAPTYLYIVSILGMVGIGLVQRATGTLARYTPPADWLRAASGRQALRSC